MGNASPSAPAPGSGDKLDRLKALLREMFQLDRGDLDFGLYRIMNMKSREIVAFLDNDLLPQVKGTLDGIGESDRASLEQERQKELDQARRHIPDPESSPVVVKLDKRLAAAKADADDEADVYNHLALFFSRYYTEGDFMSLRRYSGGGESEYLIPYGGEEVKLHWANADQYYIKTTENYSAYAFIVNGRRVRFEISAADNEKDNIKEANGNQRRFVLANGKDAIAASGEELTIRFAHRPLTNEEKKKWPGNGRTQQNRISEAAEKRILKALEPDWQAPLTELAPTDTNGKRTLLAKHLERYTAKNDFDYFIHKDLNGFLTRELDLYLKEKVLNLNDLAAGDSDRLGRALRRMRTTKVIAEKIIVFLAQLENFQKTLWLKKKFVLATNWCVTLDRVPESLYAEIAENKAQHEEWVKLFAIDEIPADHAPSLLKEERGKNESYSKPLKPAFLKANPCLVLDTRHFNRDFTDRLLAALSDAGPLDEQMDGLLVHGENFQALSLLQTRYLGQVQCVYIDPPFNTLNGDFVYKDKYPSSSWLSAMFDRCVLAKHVMSDAGHMAVHIDENEQENLNRLLSSLFGADNNFGQMIWDKRNPKGDAKGLAIQHESIFWVVKNRDVFANKLGNLARPKRNAETILDTAKKFIKKHKSLDEARKTFEIWLKEQRHFSGGELAYKEIDESGNVFRPVSMAWPNKEQAPDEYFLPLIHPKTGKPCPVPARGWRNPPDTMKKLLANGEIIFGEDEKTQPNRKYLLHNNLSDNVSSVFQYGGSSDNEAKSLGLQFETMKPLAISEYVCHLDRPEGLILDYFAGSGTTGHAVINLNRADNGNRKYILVEVGHHFDDVLLPRIKKVTHSKDWKDGKPKSREGISQLCKYIRLESYEDTLDGLELTPPNTVQQDMLAQNPALAEDYRLRYALGEETTSSACLLGMDCADPFAYTLSVVRDGERKEEPADLPETLNFLLGLRMESRRRLDGILAITGTDAEGHHCLILWRNLNETDNATLDKWFTRHRTKIPESLDLIYTNGDHTLNALKQPGETWTAQTIEPIFREMMFGENT